MNSEDERDIDELLQIRLHQNIMKDIQFSQYVLTPEFKNYFNSIPKKVCKVCGENFRVTHWCENFDRQIWIPSWEIIIRSNFKPDRPVMLDAPIEGLEQTRVQNDELFNSQQKEEIQQQIDESDCSN